MRRQAVPIALVLALSVFGGSAVEASPGTYYFGGTVSGAVGSFSDRGNSYRLKDKLKAGLVKPAEDPA